jgi:hypothetical protein
MKQQHQEPVDKFLTRLRSQAAKCNFGTPNAVDDNILDQLIKGTSHTQVRKKLLDSNPATLKLDNAVEFSRTFEATEAHLQQLNGEIPVHEHRYQDRNNSKNGTRHKHPRQRHRSRSKSKQHERNTGKCCLNCGFSHARDKCPAKFSKCDKCGRKGHWGKVCLNPADRQKSRAEHQNISSIEQEETTVTDQFERMTFSVINIDALTRNEAFATITIEPYHNRRTNLKGKVDTGAAGNIIPVRVYRQLSNHIPENGTPLQTRPSTATLTDYNGHVIEQHGTVSMPCQ